MTSTQQSETRTELAQALGDWRGCGCCSSTQALGDLLGDACTSDDGWTDHSYGDDCVLGMSTVDLLARVVAKWEESA